MRMSVVGAVLSVCLAGAAVAQDARLVASGEGVVSLEPDMAVVRMGVVADGATPEAAVDAMSDALAPILVGLIEDGIPARDVQTGSLMLRPVYEERETRPAPQGPVIAGYRAESMLVVTVRALDGLGGVLSRAVAAGGNTFDGLSWQLSDPKSAEDAALAAAVADAARKAAVMAAAAGVGLGPVLEINEHGRGARPGPVMMEARMAADVPVAAGELDVTASVSVVYSVIGQ